MTTANCMTAMVVVSASLFPLMATAGHSARTDNRANDTVVVIRGGDGQGSPQNSVRPGSRAAPSDQQVDAVIVMRPAPGSFMRETGRLAAEAEVREEHAAREDAREANQRLSEAMAAVRSAAAAVEEQSREAHYVVVAPRFLDRPRIRETRPSGWHRTLFRT